MGGNKLKIKSMIDYRPEKKLRTLKRGTVREDGKLFYGYRKGNKPNGEFWVTAEQFKKYEDQKKKYKSTDEFKKRRNEREAGAKKKYREKIKADPEAYKAYKEKHNAYVRKYLAKNPEARLMSRIRPRLRAALKSAETNKCGKTIELIGCTPKFLRSYIETRFKEGMGWHNRGEWHIDHVKPLSSFDLSKKSEQLKASHYTNLQPMWAKENFAKGAKILKQGELLSVS